MTYRKVVSTVIVNDDDAACVSQEMSVLLEQLQDELDMPSAEINDNEVLEKLPAEYEKWVEAQSGEG
jgi:hypothetical protein